MRQAGAMGIDQSRVSRSERGEDAPQLGTLRRYVEGVGGRLEVHALVHQGHHS
jgi:transcriptional regulator with XRE-family HTH domain